MCGQVFTSCQIDRLVRSGSFSGHFWGCFIKFAHHEFKGEVMKLFFCFGSTREEDLDNESFGKLSIVLAGKTMRELFWFKESIYLIPDYSKCIYSPIGLHKTS